MAAVMVITEAAPAALVIAPGIHILASTSNDTKLIRGGHRTLVVTSRKPGYVKELYRAGAWLVLPSLQNGCLDLKIVSKALGYRQNKG